MNPARQFMERRGITEIHLRIVLILLGIFGLFAPLVAWSWSISARQVEHESEIQAIKVWMEGMDREHARINDWRDNVIRNNTRIDDMLRRLDKLEMKLAIAGININDEPARTPVVH